MAENDGLAGLPVFVINMARDEERRHYMTGLLERLGVAA